MQITMDNAQAIVNTAPDGTKILAVVDVKSGITVIVPLSPESAKTVGMQLYSSLVIADHIPAEPVH